VFVISEGNVYEGDAQGGFYDPLVSKKSRKSIPGTKGRFEYETSRSWGKGAQTGTLKKPMRPSRKQGEEGGYSGRSWKQWEKSWRAGWIHLLLPTNASNREKTEQKRESTSIECDFTGGEKQKEKPHRGVALRRE